MDDDSLLTLAAPFHMYVGGIMNFLHTCWRDEDRTDQFATSALGLIGDFGETYGGTVSEFLLQEWVGQAIASARQRGSSKQARTNAAYAQKVSFTP
jgi:importin subunit beta-1